MTSCRRILLAWAWVAGSAQAAPGHLAAGAPPEANGDALVRQADFCARPSDYLCEVDIIRDLTARKRRSEAQAYRAYAVELPNSELSRRQARDIARRDIASYRDLRGPQRSQWAAWYSAVLENRILPPTAAATFETMRRGFDEVMRPLVAKIFPGLGASAGSASESEAVGAGAALARLTGRRIGLPLLSATDLFGVGAFNAYATNTVNVGALPLQLGLSPLLSEWTFHHESAHSLIQDAQLVGEAGRETLPFRRCFEEAFRIRPKSFLETFADFAGSQALAASPRAAKWLAPSSDVTVAHGGETFVAVEKVARNPLVQQLAVFACEARRSPKGRREFVSAYGHLSRPRRTDELIFGQPVLARLIGCAARPEFERARKCFE